MALTTTAAPGSYNSPVDFRIPQHAPDGLPPIITGALEEVYASMQQIIQTFINNCGIGQQPLSDWPQLAGSPATILANNVGRLYVVATEDILFGAAISLVAVTGQIQARNANATNNTKPCDGFCSTVGGILAGKTGEVIVTGGLATITGLTVGSRYYLSTVNGLITAVAPVAAGNIEQYLGIALTTTTLLFHKGYWIQH
jgi:hypothetical protein